MTYTVVTLEVSEEFYEFVKLKLEEAGYDRAIEQDMLDMHGIALTRGEPKQAAPIPMVLHCPRCGYQHVDQAKVFAPDFDSMPDDPGFREGHPDWPAAVAALRKWEDDNWVNPPHRSHKCSACLTVWRPADVPTVGVYSVKTKGKNDSWLPTTN